MAVNSFNRHFPGQIELASCRLDSVTTKPSGFGNGKVACTGRISLAATRDNGHDYEKLLGDDESSLS